MKRSIANHIRAALIGASLVVASSPEPAQAFLPDPGNIYYGIARDVFGVPYTVESTAVVSMVRVIGTLDDPFDNVPDDDITLAESPIVAPSSTSAVNFILRPSLDILGGSRYTANAGREGDTVRLFITENGVRYDVAAAAGCAVVSDPVLPLGPRATVRELNIRAINDRDGDCIADSWEAFFFQSLEFGSDEDLDGDGYNNLSEFLAGTDPFFPDQINLTRENLGLSLAFTGGNKLTVDWPRDPSRNYVLQWSTNLQTFTDIPAARLSGPRMNEVDVTGMSRVYIRVRVGR